MSNHKKKCRADRTSPEPTLSFDIGSPSAPCTVGQDAKLSYTATARPQATQRPLHHTSSRLSARPLLDHRLRSRPSSVNRRPSDPPLLRSSRQVKVRRDRWRPSSVVIKLIRRSLDTSLSKVWYHPQRAQQVEGQKARKPAGTCGAGVCSPDPTGLRVR